MAWHRGRGRGRGGGGSSWRGRGSSRNREEASGRQDPHDSVSNQSFAPRKRQRLTLNGVNSRTVTTARHEAQKWARTMEDDGGMDPESVEDEQVMPVRLVSTRTGTKAIRSHDLAATCSDSTVGHPGHLGSGDQGSHSTGKRKQPPDPEPMPGWMARAFEPEAPRSKKPRHGQPHNDRLVLQESSTGRQGPSISQLAEQHGWRAPSASLHHPSPLRPIPLDRFSSPSVPFVVYEDSQSRSESMPFRSSSSLGRNLPARMIALGGSAPVRHFSSPSSSLENHRPLGGSHSGSVRSGPVQMVFEHLSSTEQYQPSVSPPPGIVPPGFWKATPTMSDSLNPFGQPAPISNAVEADSALFASGPSHKSLYHNKLAAAAVQNPPPSHQPSTGISSAPRHFLAPHGTSADVLRPPPLSDSRLALGPAPVRHFGDSSERSGHRRFNTLDPHATAPPSFAPLQTHQADFVHDEAAEELRELTRGWRPISLPDDFA